MMFSQASPRRNRVSSAAMCFNFSLKKFPFQLKLFKCSKNTGKSPEASTSAVSTAGCVENHNFQHSVNEWWFQIAVVQPRPTTSICNPNFGKRQQFGHPSKTKPETASLPRNPKRSAIIHQCTKSTEQLASSPHQRVQPEPSNQLFGPDPPNTRSSVRPDPPHQSSDGARSTTPTGGARPTTPCNWLGQIQNTNWSGHICQAGSFFGPRGRS